MGDVEEVTKKGRGGSKSGVNVLQGGDTGGNPLWIGYLGTFGGDVQDGGGDTHGVYEVDHREAGAAEYRREMGEPQGGTITVSGGKSVGDDLHRNKTRDSGTVGDAAANF